MSIPDDNLREQEVLSRWLTQAQTDWREVHVWPSTQAKGGQCQVAFQVHLFPQTESNFPLNVFLPRHWQLNLTFLFLVQLYQIPTTNAVPLFTFIGNKFRRGPFIKNSSQCFIHRQHQEPGLFWVPQHLLCGDRNSPSVAGKQCSDGPVRARSHKSSSQGEHMCATAKKKSLTTEKSLITYLFIYLCIWSLDPSDGRSSLRACCF